jgi:NAD(P)-dependent dehydrogenase (short-subunit alcohol dehydrogenase family)
MGETSNAYALGGAVCVVTGGGSGIGRGIATAMAEDGALVAVVDLNEADAYETVCLIEAKGGRGFGIHADISSLDSIEKASAEVTAKFGVPDVLVNCAGIIKWGSLEDLTLEGWNSLISINLTGYFICSQVFGRGMLERGSGSIVHISSVASVIAAPYAGAYGVSKAGVSMLSRLLSVEWGHRGVRSNTVHPGLIYTPMSQDAYERPGLRDHCSAIVPAHRLGLPEDIAHVVLSMASPKASYVNGAEVVVDGGFCHTLMTTIPT